ncbi:MAG: sorbosone dehydrogenase family protein [Limisphaerales bacterium]
MSPLPPAAPARSNGACPAIPSVPAILVALALAVALATLGIAATPTAAGAEAPQTLRKIADGLVSPLNLLSLDAERLLVADQIGLVHVLDRSGNRRPEPFLDIRPRLTRLRQGFDERGLLGFAFHPKFPGNRRVYAYYSAARSANCPTNWDHTSHISEFTVTPDLARVDPASERLLLQVDQPYFNHNGGRLAFGSDGFLYVGIGDGGNANDEGFDRGPAGNAQDLTTLLGKFLRLDVDQSGADKPYGIPSDNPLVGKAPARPEIFAWGIRNPWGFSFDRGGARELFSADVGQGRYEEVSVIRKGGNYGWNQREGFHAFDPKKPVAIDATGVAIPSEVGGFVDPICEYRNLNTFPNEADAHGISVTGGYVYRGKALPHLQGRYVFGDWSQKFSVPEGRLLVATRPAGEADGPARRAWSVEPLPLEAFPNRNLGVYVLAFGEDAEGELYVLTTQRGGLIDRTGAVWKLVPAKGP